MQGPLNVKEEITSVCIRDRRLCCVGKSECLTRNCYCAVACSVKNTVILPSMTGYASRLLFDDVYVNLCKR